MYTDVWWGNLKERDHLDRLGIDKTDLKGILLRGSGLMWLRAGTSEGRL
jgi:hypothetical protein